jgi:SH3 domain protein
VCSFHYSWRPDPRAKITGMPKSGTPLELLEVQDDGWSFVKLINGKEGWVLSRFLNSGPPSRETIERLQKENHSLSSRAEILSEENAALKERQDELERGLSEVTVTANNLRESYETLKRGSSDYLSLQTSFANASKELSSGAGRIKGLEEEVEEMRNDRSLIWFIAGTSVILVGFILGIIYGNPKRRSYLQ